jgi:hypothetical protein
MDGLQQSGEDIPACLQALDSTSKEAVMKKTWMWCLAGLLSLGSAGRSLAQGTRSTEEVYRRLLKLYSFRCAS